MVLGFIAIGLVAGLLAAGLTLWLGGGVWLALLAYALAGAAGTLTIGALCALCERRADTPFPQVERV